MVPCQGTDNGSESRTERMDRTAYYKERQVRHIAMTAKYKDVPCMDCGQRFPPYVMDFDHVGEKRGNIAKMATSPRKAVLAEIAKCEVVCSNCHRIRTYNRRQNN